MFGLPFRFQDKSQKTNLQTLWLQISYSFTVLLNLSFKYLGQTKATWAEQWDFSPPPFLCSPFSKIHPEEPTSTQKRDTQELGGLVSESPAKNIQSWNSFGVFSNLPWRTNYLSNYITICFPASSADIHVYKQNAMCMIVCVKNPVPSGSVHDWYSKLHGNPCMYSWMC